MSQCSKTTPRAGASVSACYLSLRSGPTISCPLPGSDGHRIVSIRNKKTKKKTPHNISAAASVTPALPISRQPFQLFNCYHIIQSYYVRFHSRINFPKILLNSCFLYLVCVRVCVRLYCKCAHFVGVCHSWHQNLWPQPWSRDSERPSRHLKANSFLKQ